MTSVNSIKCKLCGAEHACDPEIWKAVKGRSQVRSNLSYIKNSKTAWAA